MTVIRIFPLKRLPKCPPEWLINFVGSLTLALMEKTQKTLFLRKIIKFHKKWRGTKLKPSSFPLIWHLIHIVWMNFFSPITLYVKFYQHCRQITANHRQPALEGKSLYLIKCLKWKRNVWSIVNWNEHPYLQGDCSLTSHRLWAVMVVCNGNNYKSNNIVLH